jgi:hypothetical protein
LLLIVTLPVTLPEAVGLNPTVKLDVCAAASVSGSEIPLSLKPVPLTVALEIVRPAVPVFFICTVCEFVVPFATVPKLTLDGVVATVPAAIAPVPFTEYCALPFEALLVNNRYPEDRPVLVGVNFTDIVMNAPAVIVCGSVNPLLLKPAACTDSPEMFTGAEPVFFTVSVMVLLEPTFTDPKLPGDGLNDSVPLAKSPCPCAAPAEKITATNRNEMCEKCRQLRRQRFGFVESVSGKTAER